MITFFTCIKSKDGNIISAEPCKNDDEWDAFIDGSEQETPFISSDYLDAIGFGNARHFLVADGIKILAFTIFSKEKMEISENPRAFSIYQGIIFPKTALNGYSKDLQQLSGLNNLTLLFQANNISTSISLHHSLTDIRGIDWAVYGTAYRYSVMTQYTGIINLTEYAGFSEYLGTTRRNRLRDYTKSMNNQEHKVCETDNVNELMDIYAKTIQNQGKNVSPFHLERISNIVKRAIEKDYGKLLIVKNSKSVESVLFVLSDRKSNFSHIGGTDPEFHHTGAGTRIYLEAIKDSFERGKEKFDFVGMNSPKRGEFKASFNARPVLYFDLTFLG